jgi:hypothetical protein
MRELIPIIILIAIKCNYFFNFDAHIFIFAFWEKTIQIQII